MKIISLFSLFLLSIVSALAQASNVSIVPKDQYAYDQWKPTYNNCLTFLVSVTDIESTGTISFSFTKVSSWPGVYMNKSSTIAEENTGPDLRFYSVQLKSAYANKDKAKMGEELPAGLPEPTPPGSIRNDYNSEKANWEVSEDGSTATFSWKSDAYLPPEGFTIKITVQSKDGGSFGILQAASDGKTVTINIPKDDNGDYIADSWEPGAWVNGRHTPPADNEKGPTGQPNTVENNTEIGDGLVVFEEYRGFQVGGKHTRLSPTQKDIFFVSDYAAFDSNGVTQLGIGNASKLPKIFSKYAVKTSETLVKPENLMQIVNFNSLGIPDEFDAESDWWVMNKRVIRIEKDTTEYASGHPDYYLLGISWPAMMRARIYSGNINRVAKEVMGRSNRLGFGWNNESEARQEILDKTIGHEIGHVMGLKHPWEVLVERLPLNCRSGRAKRNPTIRLKCCFMSGFVPLPDLHI